VYTEERMLTQLFGKEKLLLTGLENDIATGKMR
jgi:hypothetical protein